MPKKLPQEIDHCWQCPYVDMYMHERTGHVSFADFYCKQAPYYGEANKIATVKVGDVADIVATRKVIMRELPAIPEWCPLDNS